jgi:hypothetical protein
MERVSKLNLPGSAGFMAMRRAIERWNLTISLMPLIILLVIYGISTIFSSWHLLDPRGPLLKEDSIFEWVQFLCYAVASIAGFVLFLRMHASDRWNAYGWLLFAAACFFIAGEEISWGERLGGLSLEAIRSINKQDETNIHNLKIVTYSVRHGTFAVVGIFMGLGRRLFPKISVLPDGRIALFFLIPGLWYLMYTLFFRRIPDQQELYELILALGFAIHAVNSLRFSDGDEIQ